MPTGIYAKRECVDTTEQPQKHEFGWEPAKKTCSQEAQEWLAWVQHLESLPIKHEMNGGERRTVGARGLRVDGWCQNKAFEFHGCFTHACATCFGHLFDAVHPFHKKEQKTYREVYEDTCERSEYIRKVLGGDNNLVEMWACD